jgi:hypothetical protein
MHSTRQPVTEEVHQMNSEITVYVEVTYIKIVPKIRNK